LAIGEREMLSVKRNKISDIKDEVKELHPLLNRLFDRIPNITEVDYRHGPSEMGADFVLTKQHEVFKNTEYVGVIAKVGRVLQDFSSIDRQIEECGVPRTVSSGKNKIRINEIWVVVTEHVSQNAQDKIYEKFKLQNVQFIQGSKLGELIDEYLPEYWTEENLEVSDYLTALKIKNEELDKKLSLIKINDKGFYIDQDIIKQIPEHYGPKARRALKPVKVNVTQEILKHDFIMIEGSMGAGKSKLLRRLVDFYSDSENYAETKILPVPISFKELVDDYDANVEKAISEQVKSKIGPKAQEEATFLLLIDAVDEKNLSIEQQMEYLQLIRSEINDNIKIKVVITSRELRGVDPNHELLKGMSSYEIAPLSLKTIVEFLNVLCAQFNLHGRLVEDLKKSQLFRELPKSPIAAILLAQLLNENSEDLPSNLTELYAKYMELVLGRWDVEKGLQSQKEYEALDNILMRLSRYILDNELPGVSIEETKQMFQAYLEERNLGIDRDDLFDKMIQRCEVISINPINNIVSFKHKTFAEFLYAKSLLREGDLQVDGRVFQPYWTHTYFFGLGLKKDAPELIKSISDYVPDNEGERWVKLFYMADYFLAAYSTPYSTISEGVKKAMIEVANLYKDTVEGKSFSPFSLLPRMHVLFIMQYAVRQNYSYEFLKKAIEDAIYTIHGEIEDSDIKAYALFFPIMAHIEMSKDNSFDFILDEMGRSLPTDIGLAIQHETKDVKSRSSLLKKHNRRVERMFKGNTSLKAQVIKWYDVPLATLNQGNVSDAPSLPE
jgi:energy-coupling factor transporter ATP-binding protein EcfA2